MFPSLRIKEAPCLSLREISLVDHILTESRVPFKHHFPLKCRHDLGRMWLSFVIPLNYYLIQCGTIDFPSIVALTPAKEIDNSFNFLSLLDNMGVALTLNVWEEHWIYKEKGIWGLFVSNLVSLELDFLPFSLFGIVSKVKIFEC